MPPPHRPSAPPEGPSARAPAAPAEARAAGEEASDVPVVPEHQRSSPDVIYEAIMRGGGEPFGAPFVAGAPTLMARLVQRLKQRSFFSFETFERGERRAAPASPSAEAANKFTRYGAAPNRRELPRPPRTTKR